MNDQIMIMNDAELETIEGGDAWTGLLGAAAGIGAIVVACTGVGLVAEVALGAFAVEMGLLDYATSQ